MRLFIIVKPLVQHQEVNRRLREEIVLDQPLELPRRETVGKFAAVTSLIFNRILHCPIRPMSRWSGPPSRRRQRPVGFPADLENSLSVVHLRKPNSNSGCLSSSFTAGMRTSVHCGKGWRSESRNAVIRSRTKARLLCTNKSQNE